MSPLAACLRRGVTVDARGEKAGHEGSGRGGGLIIYFVKCVYRFYIILYHLVVSRKKKNKIMSLYIYYLCVLKLGAINKYEYK